MASLRPRMSSHEGRNGACTDAPDPSSRRRPEAHGGLRGGRRTGHRGRQLVQAHGAPLLDLRSRRRRRIPAQPRDPPDEGADGRPLRAAALAAHRHQARGARPAAASGSAPSRRRTRARTSRRRSRAWAGGNGQRPRARTPHGGGARHAQAQRAAVPGAEGARLLLRRDLAAHRIQLDQGQPVADGRAPAVLRVLRRDLLGRPLRALPAAPVRSLRRTGGRRGGAHRSRSPVVLPGVPGGAARLPLGPARLAELVPPAVVLPLLERSSMWSRFSDWVSLAAASVRARSARSSSRAPRWSAPRRRRRSWRRPRRWPAEESAVQEQVRGAARARAAGARRAAGAAGRVAGARAGDGSDGHRRAGPDAPTRAPAEQPREQAAAQKRRRPSSAPSAPGAAAAAAPRWCSARASVRPAPARRRHRPGARSGCGERGVRAMRLARPWRQCSPALRCAVAAPAHAGIYEVRACGSVAGAAQNAFVAMADPMMSAYSICPPSSGVGTGIVTKATSNGGRAPYLAGRVPGVHRAARHTARRRHLQSRRDPPELRLVGGDRRLQQRLGLGRLPVRLLPVDLLLRRRALRCSRSRQSVNLFSHAASGSRRAASTRSGCDLSASPFNPANRGLFSAANVTVRVRDEIPPALSSGTRGLVERRLASRLTRRPGPRTPTAPGSWCRGSTSTASRTRRRTTATDPWPDWVRCNFTRPRPCVDVVPGGFGIEHGEPGGRDAPHRRGGDWTPRATRRRSVTRSRSTTRFPPSRRGRRWAGERAGAAPTASTCAGPIRRDRWRRSCGRGTGCAPPAVATASKGQRTARPSRRSFCAFPIQGSGWRACGWRTPPATTIRHAPVTRCGCASTTRRPQRYSRNRTLVTRARCACT